MVHGAPSDRRRASTERSSQPWPVRYQRTARLGKSGSISARTPSRMPMRQGAAKGDTTDTCGQASGPSSRRPMATADTSARMWARTPVSPMGRMMLAMTTGRGVRGASTTGWSSSATAGAARSPRRAVALAASGILRLVTGGLIDVSMAFAIDRAQIDIVQAKEPHDAALQRTQRIAPVLRQRRERVLRLRRPEAQRRVVVGDEEGDPGPEHDPVRDTRAPAEHAQAAQHEGHRQDD